MSLDVSEVVDVTLVETGDPEGPFRAKGVAAIAIVPTAAAIAHALNHSLGVRLPGLPFSPVKILEANGAISSAV